MVSRVDSNVAQCHSDWQAFNETTTRPVASEPVPVGGNSGTGTVGDVVERSNTTSVPAEQAPQPQQASEVTQTPEQQAAKERLANAEKAHAEALEKAKNHEAEVKKHLKAAREQKAIANDAVKKLNEANGKLMQLDPKDPKSFERAQRYLDGYKHLSNKAKAQQQSYHKLVKEYCDATKRYNSAMNSLKTARTNYNNAMQATRDELKAARTAVADANKAAKPKGNFFQRFGKGIAKFVKSPAGMLTLAIFGVLGAGIAISLSKNDDSTDTSEEQVIKNDLSAVSEEVEDTAKQNKSQPNSVVEPNSSIAQKPDTTTVVAQPNVEQKQAVDAGATANSEAEEVQVTDAQMQAEAQELDKQIKQTEADFEKMVSKGGCMWNIVKDYLKNQNNNVEPTDTEIANTLNELMDDERIEVTSTTNDVRTAVWAGQDRSQIYIHSGEKVRIKPKQAA